MTRMIPVAQLREELASAGTISDPRLIRLMDRTIETLEARTGRLWLRRSDYEHVWRDHGDRATNLWSPLYPIEEITLVTWYLGEDEDDADTFDTDDYRVYAERGRIERIDGGYWPTFVKATITGGHDEGQFPGDVVEAVIQQMQYSLVRNSPQRIAQKSQSVPQGGTSSYMTDELHPAFKSVIKRYRRLARTA